MTPAEKLDHTPLTRGRYKGKTPSDVADIDPAYLVWMCDSWQQMPCSILLYDECRGDMESPDEPDAPRFR